MDFLTPAKRAQAGFSLTARWPRRIAEQCSRVLVLGESPRTSASSALSLDGIPIFKRRVSERWKAQNGTLS